MGMRQRYLSRRRSESRLGQDSPRGLSPTRVTRQWPLFIGMTARNYNLWHICHGDHFLVACTRKLLLTFTCWHLMLELV
jgi:hypothetical protein